MNHTTKKRRIINANYPPADVSQAELRRFWGEPTEEGYFNHLLSVDMQDAGINIYTSEVEKGTEIARMRVPKMVKNGYKSDFAY